MSNELAIMQTLTPAIFNPVKEGEKKGVDTLLEKVKEEVANFNGDISTPAGRKEIASFAHKIATSKTAIDGMGKKLTQAAKDQISLVDKDRKKIRDEFDALKALARKPLTDWENTEKERVAEHERLLIFISEAGVNAKIHYNAPVDLMQASLNEVSDLGLRDWQEFASRAALAIDSAKKEIREAIQKKISQEKQQAELEKLRKEKAEREQKERDEKMKREAAENARLAAERAAEQEKLAAQKVAAEEKARIEAQKKAAEDQKAEAERRVREVEDKRVADAERAEREKAEAVKRERERIEAAEEAKRKEEAARAADLAHKRSIDGQIIQALLDIGLGNVVAETVVDRMAAGSIPFVKINY